jgi:ferritin-like metal-binding protein YciE
VFARFDRPVEAYQFKLGAALKMEQTIVSILDESIDAAGDEQVQDVLRRHREETREHLEVLEQVFGVFEWEVDVTPCSAIEGLEQERKAMLEKTDASFADVVILQSCVEIEHHELGVYTNLIVNARAMGRQDVVDLLEQIRRSEEHALHKATSQLQQLVAAENVTAADGA